MEHGIYWISENHIVYSDNHILDHMEHGINIYIYIYSDDHDDHTD